MPRTMSVENGVVATTSVINPITRERLVRINCAARFGT